MAVAPWFALLACAEYSTRGVVVLGDAIVYHPEFPFPEQWLRAEDATLVLMEMTPKSIVGAMNLTSRVDVLPAKKHNHHSRAMRHHLESDAQIISADGSIDRPVKTKLVRRHVDPYAGEPPLSKNSKSKGGLMRRETAIQQVHVDAQGLSAVDAIGKSSKKQLLSRTAARQGSSLLAHIGKDVTAAALTADAEEALVKLKSHAEEIMADMEKEPRGIHPIVEAVVENCSAVLDGSRAFDASLYHSLKEFDEANLDDVEEEMEKGVLLSQDNWLALGKLAFGESWTPDSDLEDFDQESPGRDVEDDDEHADHTASEDLQFRSISRAGEASNHTVPDPAWLNEPGKCPSREAGREVFKRWSMPLKYCWLHSVNTTDALKADVLKAMNIISSHVPCITWKEISVVPSTTSSSLRETKCSEDLALVIGNFNLATPAAAGTKHGGFGMHPGGSIMHLMHCGTHPENCYDFVTVLHEFGHILGRAHEQQRPDRDSFLDIHWEHVNPGNHQFCKVTDAWYPGFGVTGYEPRDYDFDSIMHYSARTGGGGFVKMTAKHEFGAGRVLGQRHGLSAGDVQTFREMYGCEFKSTKWRVSTKSTTSNTLLDIQQIYFFKDSKCKIPSYETGGRFLSSSRIQSSGSAPHGAGKDFKGMFWVGIEFSSPTPARCVKILSGSNHVANYVQIDRFHEGHWEHEGFPFDVRPNDWTTINFQDASDCADKLPATTNDVGVAGKWVDNWGYGCNSYRYGLNCWFYGHRQNLQMTARQACCACGGGHKIHCQKLEVTIMVGSEPSAVHWKVTALYVADEADKKYHWGDVAVYANMYGDNYVRPHERHHYTACLPYGHYKLIAEDRQGRGWSGGFFKIGSLPEQRFWGTIGTYYFTTGTQNW